MAGGAEALCGDDDIYCSASAADQLEAGCDDIYERADGNQLRADGDDIYERADGNQLRADGDDVYERADGDQLRAEGDDIYERADASSGVPPPAGEEDSIYGLASPEGERQPEELEAIYANGAANPSPADATYDVAQSNPMPVTELANTYDVAETIEVPSAGRSFERKASYDVAAAPRNASARPKATYDVGDAETSQLLATEPDRTYEIESLGATLEGARAEVAELDELADAQHESPSNAAAMPEAACIALEVDEAETAVDGDGYLAADSAEAGVRSSEDLMLDDRTGAGTCDPDDSAPPMTTGTRASWDEAGDASEQGCESDSDVVSTAEADDDGYLGCGDSAPAAAALGFELDGSELESLPGFLEPNTFLFDEQTGSIKLRSVRRGNPLFQKSTRVRPGDTMGPAEIIEEEPV